VLPATPPPAAPEDQPRVATLHEPRPVPCRRLRRPHGLLGPFGTSQPSQVRTGSMRAVDIYPSVELTTRGLGFGPE